jgi:hypothetical protein
VWDKINPNSMDNVKWALVKIGDKNQLIGVNNKTMKGFKFDSETREFLNEPQEFDKFIRWATGHDL